MLTKILQIVGTPRQWNQDAALRKLFKNAGILFSGNIATLPINLVSLTLTARGLGVESFGILTLIITYVGIIDRLVNFQSSYAIIKYGTDALAQRNHEKFDSLIRLGFLIDGATAVIGTVLSVFAAYFIGNWKGWDVDLVLLSALYSLTIIFHISGPPKAILRLFNCFRILALSDIFFSIFKLIGISTAFALNSGLLSYLIVLAFTDILKNIFLLSFSFREMIKRDLMGFISSDVRLALKSFKNIFRFLVTTNLHASVRLSISEIDIFLVGIFLSPANAGLYKIIKTIGGNLSRLTDPLYSAVYPDLSKAISSGNISRFNRLIIRPLPIIGLVVLMANLAFLLIGKQVIILSLGSEFLGIFYPTLVYLVGVSIAMLTFSFHPALLALDKPETSFKILSISALAYILFICLLVKLYGLAGASISYVIFYSIWALLQSIAIYRAKRSRKTCATE